MLVEPSFWWAKFIMPLWTLAPVRIRQIIIPFTNTRVSLKSSIHLLRLLSCCQKARCAERGSVKKKKKKKKREQEQPKPLIDYQNQGNALNSDSRSRPAERNFKEDFAALLQHLFTLFLTRDSGKPLHSKVLKG